MSKGNFNKKRVLKIAGNVLFYSLLLLLVFNTDAKSWMLKQLLSTGLFRAEIKKEGAAAVSGHTPSFSYTDATGKQRSTADLKGKVVFINFWASWCPPCRAEMPSLNALYQKFKDDDRFVFLFVNEDEDAAKAKAYLQKEGFAFPFVASAGDMPVAIFSGTLPTTLVLDKKGNAVLKHEGLARYNTGEFIEQLKSLL
jgi:thiol-disulfide isomerase/thioredoxin